MKALDLRGKKFEYIGYSRYNPNNIAVKDSNTMSYGALKKDVLVLEEDAPVILFEDKLPDNVNVYTKLSQIPKGIAKALNVAFVNKIEDADVIIKQKSSANFYSSPIDKIMYSKSLDMFVLLESDDFQTSLKKVLRKQYEADDFKCIYRGYVYYADGNTYDEYKNSVQNSASFVDVDAVYTKYMNTLPNCTLEEMKSMYRMVACSDEQTKELGLKMLIQYNPAQYPSFMSYIFRSRNSSIQKIKSHSSYINFYSHCVRKLINHWGRTYSIWAAERNAKDGSDDKHLMIWIQQEGLQLT